MKQRILVPIMVVSLIANAVLTGFLLFGPKGLLRSEASSLTDQATESLARVGTVTARDGLILSFFETGSSEISVIALVAGTPVREANADGQFVAADETKLGANDIVSLNYGMIGDEKVMLSVDILQNN